MSLLRLSMRHLKYCLAVFVLTPLLALAQGADPVVALAAAQMSTSAVKGVPFCADTATESVQILGDGNRITKRHNTRICRDAEGRTRQEVLQLNSDKEVKRVFISDVVSHELWMLNPQNLVAIKLPSLNDLPPPPGAPISAPLGKSGTPEQQARWRDYAQRVREWARGGRSATPAASTPQAAGGPMTPPPSTGPQSVMIAPPSDAQDHTERKTIEVTRWMGSEGMGPEMFVAMNRVPPERLAKGQSKTLGTKDIEGVRAEGTLTTWTIEAGAVGNEKPIVITREEWRSPDLKLPLLSRFSDPRNGETQYRISNLSRSVPPAEMFKVPSEYRLRQR